MASLTATGTGRRRRRITARPILALLGLVCGSLPAAAAAPSLEMAVKASYLYKFAPFVQWPSRAFASASSPFRICVAGDDAIGGALDQAVRGQRMQDHPITITHLATVEPATLANCQILFVGKSAGAELLRGVAGQPVLTVTDRSRGGTGGIIQFVMQGNRVRFAVDIAAANSAGIQISSKLLGLAVEVAR
jgi:hypothetical protein